MLKSKNLILAILIFLILACENRKEKEVLSKKNADHLLHSTKVDTVKLKLPVEEKQPTQDEEYYYKKAHKLWYNEKTYQAISGLKEFIKKYPKSSLADDAQKLLGTAYSNVYEFKNAIQSYEKVLEKYPNSNSASIILYDLAYLYFYELNDLTNAKKYYEQFIAEATEDERKWYKIAKGKLNKWPSKTNNLGDIEKAIDEKKNNDQKDNPTKYLEMTKDVWFDDEYSKGYLFISVKNHSNIDYKDLVIKLNYYSETWTALSAETITIYKKFPKKKLKVIESFETGYGPSNAEYGISSIIRAKPY